MKHQLDATLCRFYFCRVTLHVSGASAHHQEYLKLVRRPLLRVYNFTTMHGNSKLKFGDAKQARDIQVYKFYIKLYWNVCTCMTQLYLLVDICIELII